LKTYIPYTSGQLPFAFLSQTAMNGFITVAPFTPLISPNDTPIDVNVYVKCPNLMVNRMTDVNLPRERTIIYTESSMDADFSQDVSCIVLNDSTAQTDTICQEHYGERPVSFRGLLKRYVTSLYLSIGFGPSTSPNMIKVVDNVLPRINNAYGASLGLPMDLLSYLRYAYVGYRGSIKKRISFIVPAHQQQHAWTRVSLLADTTADVNPYMFARTFSPSSDLAIRDHLAILGGTVTFDQWSNGGVEVEFPYYSNNLFNISFAYDTIGINPGQDENVTPLGALTYQASIVVDPNPAESFSAVQVDTCIGEDFTFLRFQASPTFSVSLS